MVGGHQRAVKYVTRLRLGSMSSSWEQNYAKTSSSFSPPLPAIDFEIQRSQHPNQCSEQCRLWPRAPGTGDGVSVCWGGGGSLAILCVCWRVGKWSCPSISMLMRGHLDIHHPVHSALSYMAWVAEWISLSSASADGLIVADLDLEACCLPIRWYTKNNFMKSWKMHFS
jgi:hypothetical protein